MSKPIPYMQFYVSDYMGDTTHLTTEQHGAYDLILFNYWHRQKPIEEEKLAQVTKLGPDKWLEHRDVIAEFFQIAGGKWKHKRIEIELKKVRDQAKKNRAAGIKSGESRRAKAKQNERALNGRSANDEQNVKQSYVKGRADAAPIAKARLSKKEDDLMEARTKVFALEAELAKLGEAS